MSSNAERVEIYSGIQRRRRYSVDQKLRIVQEVSQPGITISYVARQHGISPSLFFHWRRRVAEGGKEAIRVDEEVVGSSEIKALERRIRELERVLGRKTLEDENLREAVKVAHEKTDLALAVIARRRFAVKTVADTIGVSRSQLQPRPREGSRPRGRYRKTEDAELLASVRTLTDDRSTYGYRRIWALLNRQREKHETFQVEPQTHLSPDVAKRPLAAALYRKAARPSARRSDHHDPPEPALDL